MLLVNNHIHKMAAILKPRVIEAAIIESLRAARSVTEIIRFFGYPRSTVHDVVVKYTALKQFNEGSSEEESFTRSAFTRKNTAKTPRSCWKSSSVDFGWSRAIVAKISIDCWCKRANNAWIAEKDFRYKSYTLKIQMFSEAARTSRVARFGSHFGLPIAQI